MQAIQAFVLVIKQGQMDGRVSSKHRETLNDAVSLAVVSAANLCKFSYSR